MDALLELEKVKVIVSEEALLKGALPSASVKLTVVLPFTILLELQLVLPPLSLAVTPEFAAVLTEPGMPVKTKVIVSAAPLIVLLHVLLPNALFDKTTLFEALLPSA